MDHWPQAAVGFFQEWKATAPRIRTAIAPTMQAYRDLFDVKLGLGLDLDLLSGGGTKGAL